MLRLIFAEHKKVMNYNLQMTTEEPRNHHRYKIGKPDNKLVLTSY